METPTNSIPTSIDLPQQGQHQAVARHPGPALIERQQLLLRIQGDVVYRHPGDDPVSQAIDQSLPIGRSPQGRLHQPALIGRIEAAVLHCRLRPLAAVIALGITAAEFLAFVGAGHLLAIAIVALASRYGTPRRFWALWFQLTFFWLALSFLLTLMLL